MTATQISFDATLKPSDSAGATALIESALNPATDPISNSDKFVAYTLGNTGYIVRVHSPP